MGSGSGGLPPPGPCIRKSPLTVTEMAPPLPAPEVFSDVIKLPTAIVMFPFCTTMVIGSPLPAPDVLLQLMLPGPWGCPCP